MGTFNYNNMVTVDMEDRLLAHLERVIVSKLRRQEKFQFSWLGEDGESRKAVWIEASIPVTFSYEHVVDDFNPAWLKTLVMAATTEAGLRPLPEPEMPTAKNAKGAKSTRNEALRRVS
jgi:hypothetical protein